jgi:hypothetical protein
MLQPIGAINPRGASLRAVRGAVRSEAHRRAFLCALALVLGLPGAAARAQAPSAAPPAAGPESAQKPSEAPDAGGPGIGDLLVAPTRLIFEGRTRAAELTLINIGRQTATYRISFIHMQMLEGGDLREIEKPEPGAPFADDLIRYSPRQVTLEPNVAQTIRLQVRKPENLADGEYRSHLLFRAVPPEQAIPANVVENDPGKRATGLSIRLTPIYGVSIPVIVRQGQASARLALTDLRVVRPARATDPLALEMKLVRTGNTSLYGNLRVTWVPASGREHVVANVNGIAIYTPNGERTVQVALQAPPGVVLAGGRLRVSFSRAEQNAERMASAETSLP